MPAPLCGPASQMIGPVIIGHRENLWPFFIRFERRQMMPKQLAAVLIETDAEQTAIMSRNWLINKIDKEAKQEFIGDYRRFLRGRI